MYRVIIKYLWLIQYPIDKMWQIFNNYSLLFLNIQNNINYDVSFYNNICIVSPHPSYLFAM